ncbi:MAG: hypothetical protein JO167_07990, partial [Alphaproteobacteria bacterium]|nr:hypothetical protein [Alphaproteobacteria bacterium]
MGRQNDQEISARERCGLCTARFGNRCDADPRRLQNQNENGGSISPFYGNIDPFAGGVTPQYGNINPFYGNINPFYGQISPFWGDISPFWGDINP